VSQRARVLVLLVSAAGLTLAAAWLWFHHPTPTEWVIGVVWGISNHVAFWLGAADRTRMDRR